MTTTTIKDFLEILTAGARPVVEFRGGIDQKESYAQPNMRARILGVQNRRDDIIEIIFDFEEFTQHNTPLESTGYYDKDRKPTLTARQAGYYHPQEGLYFDETEVVADVFVVVDDAQVALFNRYKEAGATMSYVAWLEAQVLAGQPG